MSARTWIVSRVYTSPSGNVYVDATELGGTADTTIPIGDFTPESVPLLCRGAQFTHELRGERVGDRLEHARWEARINAQPGLYHGLHVALDYCEQHAIDATLVADALALVVYASNRGPEVAEMLTASGWDDPLEGSDLARIRFNASELVRTHTKRLAERFGLDTRRQPLRIAAWRVSDGSISRESIRAYQEQSCLGATIVARLDVDDEPNPAQYTMAALSRALEGVHPDWRAWRGEDGDVRITRPGWSAPIRILAEHLDDVRAALAPLGAIP